PAPIPARRFITPGMTRCMSPSRLLWSRTRRKRKKSRRVNRYRNMGRARPPARLHEMEEIKMAVTKTIEIDGKQVKFKASAAVPRLYRVKFGRDIYKDLRMLEKSVGDNDEDASNMDLFSLELFEDLA